MLSVIKSTIFSSVGNTPNQNSGSLYTQAKSDDHEIEGPEKVFKGHHPKTLPKSCNVVPCPQVCVKSYVLGPQSNIVSMTFYSYGVLSYDNI